MKKFFSKNKKLILSALFTLGALLVWRIGVYIKIPFVSVNDQLAKEESLFGFLDIFTGGALSQFSIVALGVSPYITASIVVQLLQMDIVPQFAEWAEEGESGKAKLNQWTRYIALFLAFVQALTIIITYIRNYGSYFLETFDPNPFIYVYMALVMTAGTAFVLWLSDQITMKGIGNGASMMIVAGIIAGLPAMFKSLITQFLTTTDSHTPVPKDYIIFAVIILVLLLVLVGVVFLEGLQRKIPIQYSNRPAAAQVRGKQDSNIPIKLNSASVIPVIFAATLLSLPLTIINFIKRQGSTISEWWEIVFSYRRPIGFAIYIILIFLFTFFYSFLQINPDKMSENLKKQNAYIPGVKPGEDTAAYISKVLFKITVLGATYLAVLASLPIILGNIFGLDESVQIGGTSIMIVVGVAIETAKQIKTQAQSQEYRGFLR